MTHTPGPWEWRRPAHPDTAGASYSIKTTSEDKWNEYNGYVATLLANSPNAEANARLIATAPDMLAALKGMVADYEEFWGKEPGGWKNTDVARAAIAKAEERK